MLNDDAGTVCSVTVTKDVQISVRLEPALVARFDRLVVKLGGAATRASLVRLSMLAGLPSMEERYEDLPDAPLVPPVKAKAAKRRRSER